MLSVSVVICTHNGATRLPATLSCLASQKFRENIRWEVIVIDNASTDGSAEVATISWPSEAPAALRVVSEPVLGLSNARLRGFAEAKYEIVSFVDDDNWVSDAWVQTVSELMTGSPQIGACGGISEGVFETTPPEWFHKFSSFYAVGRQSDKSGDITEKIGRLWGAGMSVRKSAWDRLERGGFRHALVDRKGKALTSGGDTELCLALRLAGWRLWFDDRLRMKHYIPQGRLNWNYLRRLNRAFGAASVTIEIYREALQKNPAQNGSIRHTWVYQFLATAGYIAYYYAKYALLSRNQSEGDENICYLDYLIGRAPALLKARGRYASGARELQEATWSN